MGFSFTPLFDPEDYRRALVDNEFNVASVFQQMMADAPDRHRVFVEEYNKVMEKCRSLLATRNDEDYNQMVALPDYFPFGEYSYCHMLFLKCMRAINQILAGSDPSDSLEDLINYAAFTAAWFQLRGEGRIPEVSYGPANPAKRRSEMERELFQGGQGNVTKDTKLIGGEIPKDVDDLAKNLETEDMKALGWEFDPKTGKPLDPIPEDKGGYERREPNPDVRQG